MPALDNLSNYLMPELPELPELSSLYVYLSNHHLDDKTYDAEDEHIFTLPLPHR